jgi:23S rRNA-/tRNA-specific pseudouridylate synthase
MVLRTLCFPFRTSFNPKYYYSPFSDCVTSRRRRRWYAGILPILLFSHNAIPWHWSVICLLHIPRGPSRSRVLSTGVIRTRGIHSIDEASSIDWCQLIYDAYLTAETDGIIQLGESYISTPLENLNPNELWQVTRQAAQRLALHFSQTKTRKNATLDGNSWKGMAASMLNGWIAACSLLHSSSSENAEDRKQHMAQYAQDLFEVATGRGGAHPSNRNPRATQGPGGKQEPATTVAPDLVTYAVLYTALYPVDPVSADHFLHLAIRWSKKVSGTQRRKLLLSLGKKPSAQSDGDSATFFLDREKDFQVLLNSRHQGHSNSNCSVNDTDVFVLRETDNFVVLNKPSGVCCYHMHVTTSGKRNEDLSVVDLLMRLSTSREQLSSLNSDALGIVHRLDRGTSGCLIVAKNDSTHARFVAQLFTRQIHKTYTVLVSPAPSMERYNTTGFITIPVHGKPAKSKYTILERYSVVDDSGGAAVHGISQMKTAALINVTTFTGRQHQVRVHCAHGLETPVIGDELYNGHTSSIVSKDRRVQKKPALAKVLERFHLHASSLNIPCINETIYAPLPAWWLPVLDYWRNGTSI